MVTMQAATSEWLSSRAWLTVRMLAPLSATTRSICKSPPGLSGTLVVSSTMRPALERPLVMTRERVVTSTLPPETKHTVVLEQSTLPNMQAATVVAPAPSATVFCSSISARMAEAISSSVTVTTSSTYLAHSS